MSPASTPDIRTTPIPPCPKALANAQIVVVLFTRKSKKAQLFLITTVENAPFGNTKYHKSCCKAYVSKQNLSPCSNFKSTRLTSASCNQNPSSNEDNFTIVTRSRASEIDWTYCIFCIHKAFKHDRKMHKVSSENRTQSIKRVAEQISDSEMIFKVTSEDFAENALYHSACITRYLLSQNRDRGTSDVRA